MIVRNPDQDPADILWPAFTIGYERIVGELDGGMPAWAAAGGDVVITRLVGPHEVDGAVLDVRQRVEYAAGHLPTAVHLELGELLRASGGAPDGPTVVMCGHGERAMTAASVLHRAGRRDVSVLLGGADDWAAATGRRLRDAPRPWMNRDW